VTPKKGSRRKQAWKPSENSEIGTVCEEVTDRHEQRARECSLKKPANDLRLTGHPRLRGLLEMRRCVQAEGDRQGQLLVSQARRIEATRLLHWLSQVRQGL
jgi:hypothetical protein